MKKHYKKIVYILILSILFFGIFCSIGSGNVNAESIEGLPEDSKTFSDYVGNVLGGIVGALTYGWKILFLLLGELLRILMVAIVKLGGTQDSLLDISPATFIFNKSNVTKIDFFNGSSSGVLADITTQVAKWYYILRNFSVVIILGILIYVGIRMAISTVASEQAQYKKMLKDWVVSLILVYVLHYFMILIIFINNQLVVSLSSALNDKSFSAVSGTLLTNALALDFAQGWACTIVFVLFNASIFLWMLMYIKRLITVAFLTMISPLITITYSMDKIGDGKSQALNSWMKEFTYNILIQPFHCIIYLSLMGVALGVMLPENGNVSIAGAVVTIMIMLFMLKAEDIVKKIFGFESSSLGSTLAAGAVGMAAISQMSKIGKGKKQIGDIKQMPKMKANALNSATNAGAGASANSKTSKLGNNTQQSGSNKNAGGSTQTQSRSNAGSATSSNVNSASTTISPNKEPGVLKRAGKALGNSFNPKWMAKEGVQKVMPMFMAAVGMGLTGDMKGATAGAATGNQTQENIRNKWDESNIDRQEAANEQVFEHEYNNWAALASNQGLDEEALAEKTETIMSARKTSLTEDEKQYREVIDDMSKTYKVAGKDNPDEAVFDLISSINMKNNANNAKNS